MKISQIPVGNKIYDSKGHSFIVADHSGSCYKGTVLISEKVIRMMAFDTPKEGYEQRECKKFGSNDYEGSDLNKWLNSEDGYMSELSDKLKDNILVSHVPYSGMQDNLFTIEAKVFIPSVSELGLKVYDHVKEGEELALFREFRMRYAMPSKQLVENRPQGFNVLDENDTWCYWLRSAHPKHPCILYSSHSHSPYAFCEAYRDYVGVRPMMAVNDDMDISENGKGGNI